MCVFVGIWNIPIIAREAPHGTKLLLVSRDGDIILGFVIVRRYTGFGSHLADDNTVIKLHVPVRSMSNFPSGFAHIVVNMHIHDYSCTMRKSWTVRWIIVLCEAILLRIFNHNVSTGFKGSPASWANQSSNSVFYIWLSKWISTCWQYW